VVGMGLIADPHDEFSVVILGTGFLVDNNGWIMTNRHVAEIFIGQGDQLENRGQTGRSPNFVGERLGSVPSVPGF